MSENSKLNPQIKTVEIGVRELREIPIYPLSFADQLEMTDLITKTVQEFFARRGEMIGPEPKEPQEGPESEEADLQKPKNLEVVSFIVGLIRENIEKILKLVADDLGEDPLRDITNAQFLEIVDIIYVVNYESISKNVKDLFEKIRKVLPSKRSLLESVKDTPSTDSKTSIESPGEKEDLPSDK